MKRPLLILALVVVVTRVGMLAYVYPQAERLYNGDSWLYEQYALSMLATGEYLGTGFGRVDENPFADMIRPPGLPVLLAGVYAVVGPQWGPWAMMVASLAGNLATLGLMWLLLGLVAAPPNAGSSGQQPPKNWHVLWIFVLDPVWIMYSKELITEPYFTPLLLGSIYLAARAVLGTSAVTSDLKKKALPAEVVLLGASGLLLGLATLFKPITWYAPWLVLILLPLAWRLRAGGWGLRRLTPALLVFLLAAQLPIFGWQLRNYHAHETLAFTSIAADNMMTGHAAFVLSAAQGITHTEAIGQIRTTYRDRNPEESSYTFEEQSRAKMSVAREILADHPALYLRAVLRGVAATLMDPGRLVVERTFGANSDGIGLTETLARDGLRATAVRLLREHPQLTVYAAVYMVVLMVLSGLALAGAWTLLRRNPALGVILIAVVLYLLVLGSIGGYARFRMYVLPVMVLFVAALPWRRLRGGA